MRIGSTPITRTKFKVFMKTLYTDEYLHNVLLSILGTEELVSQWWSSPNKAFGDQTPDEIYKHGDASSVVAYILNQVNV